MAPKGQTSVFYTVPPVPKAASEDSTPATASEGTSDSTTLQESSKQKVEAAVSAANKK